MNRARALLHLLLIGLLAGTAFGPMVTSAQTAQPTPGNSALASMLGNLPADALTTEQPVHFADLALQYGVVQMGPDADTIDRLGALWGLSLNRIWSGVDFMTVPDIESDFEGAFGFSFAQIERMAGVKIGEDRVTLFQGSFNQARIIAALTAGGYLWREEVHMQVAQYGEDGEIDFASDMGLLVFNFSAANVTFLPDGTLAFAASTAAMSSVLAAATGAEETLLTRADVQSLLAGFDLPLASLTIFDGADFASSCADDELVRNPNLSPEQQTDLAAALAEVTGLAGVMPPSQLVAIGVTTGGPSANLSSFRYLDEAGWPDARAVMLVLSNDLADAGGVMEVIRGRLDVGFSFSQIKPWRDLYATWFVTVDAVEPVVRVDLIAQPGEMPHWWDLSTMNDLTLPIHPSSTADCPDYLN